MFILVPRHVIFKCWMFQEVHPLKLRLTTSELWFVQVQEGILP